MGVELDGDGLVVAGDGVVPVGSGIGIAIEVVAGGVDQGVGLGGSHDARTDDADIRVGVQLAQLLGEAVRPQVSNACHKNVLLSMKNGLIWEDCTALPNYWLGQLKLVLKILYHN